MISYAVIPEADAIGETLYKNFGQWPDIPKIKYLIKISDKSRVNGQISKATGKWQYLTQYDYVLEVWDGFWTTATAIQKEALIYHELYHISFKEDEDTGEITWKLKDHEIEEFLDVAKKYGAWNEALKELQFILARETPNIPVAPQIVEDVKPNV
jgi:hypothetical protein